MLFLYYNKNGNIFVIYQESIKWAKQFAKFLTQPYLLDVICLKNMRNSHVFIKRLNHVEASIPVEDLAAYLPLRNHQALGVCHTKSGPNYHIDLWIIRKHAQRTFLIQPCY